MARIKLKFPEQVFCFQTRLAVRSTDLNGANHLGNRHAQHRPKAHTMSFSRMVEISSVFPSLYGGEIFRGTPVGFKTMSFGASRSTLSRIPAEGGFWKVDGETLETKEYGNAVIVKSAFLHELPSFNYVENFLKNYPAFRSFHFGKSKVQMLGSVNVSLHRQP